jgi:hypothetical protein
MSNPITEIVDREMQYADELLRQASEIRTTWDREQVRALYRRLDGSRRERADAYRRDGMTLRDAVATAWVNGGFDA